MCYVRLAVSVLCAIRFFLSIINFVLQKRVCIASNINYRVYYVFWDYLKFLLLVFLKFLKPNQRSTKKMDSDVRDS
jgi:hypothetical protein